MIKTPKFDGRKWRGVKLNLTPANRVKFMRMLSAEWAKCMEKKHYVSAERIANLFKKFK